MLGRRYMLNMTMCNIQMLCWGPYLVARSQVAHFGQLHLVYMHQQLYSSFPDFQCRHVGQEVIAHKEAHEHCTAEPCVNKQKEWQNTVS